MKKYIWALIMIVILAVIFIFSNQQVSVSYKVSSNVTQTINETVTNYVELDENGLLSVTWFMAGITEK